MATGRSVLKYGRVYVDGYDLSGYARSMGPFDTTFQEGPDDPLNASVVGTWLGQASISPGTLNSLFDNTATTGIHALMSTPAVKRTLIYAQGIQAAPAAGDPCFCGEFAQNDYMLAPQETPSSLTLGFGKVYSAATAINYPRAWGILVHPNGAETTDNGAIGIDQLAASTDGGYMVYEVLTASGAGNITATFKIQDATTNENADFGDLLSSGSINCGAGGVAVPTKGVVALAAGSAVKRFIRWQVAWGTATSVTFVLSFVRHYT